MFANKKAVARMMADLESGERNHELENFISSSNKPINIHHKPGFFPKSLLLSIILNAVFLIIIAYQYMEMKKLVQLVNLQAHEN